MKLLRHGAKGQERPGFVDESGAIRDLGDVISDISPATIAADLLGKLRAVDLTGCPVVSPETRIGPCVARPANFIAVGLNYIDHARETNSPIPSEPIIFTKFTSCIVGPNDEVVLPPGSKKGDWEVELAFVMGKTAYRVSEEDALDHVLGYCICNDVSEREYQIERGGGQWIKGKGLPTFGPLGPWLVTSDEIADPHALELWLDVNDRRVQSSTTGNMIFSIAQLVSHISQFTVLEPGDVVTTGTPHGVGLGLKPPQFLKPGDVMRLGITHLGEQTQRVLGS